MKVSPNLTAEDKKILEGQGIVFSEGSDPHFEPRKAPVPAGHIRLPSGKVVDHSPIEKERNNWS